MQFLKGFCSFYNTEAGTPKRMAAIDFFVQMGFIKNQTNKTGDGEPNASKMESEKTEPAENNSSEQTQQATEETQTAPEGNQEQNQSNETTQDPPPPVEENTAPAPPVVEEKKEPKFQVEWLGHNGVPSKHTCTELAIFATESDALQFAETLKAAFDFLRHRGSVPTVKITPYKA